MAMAVQYKHKYKNHKDVYNLYALTEWVCLFPELYKSKKCVKCKRDHPSLKDI